MKVFRASLFLSNLGITKKVAILSAFLPLFLFFQNCSKISNSAFDTVSLSSNAGLPGERKVNLTVETLTSSLAGKVKVLLIVDNSATMSFSQANLSRNISALLDKLKDFDLDLKVVSTTFSTPSCSDASVSGGVNCPSLPAFLSNKTNNLIEWNTPINSVRSYETSVAKINEINPFYSIRRAMNVDQKNGIIAQISQSISAMNTQGSDNEEAFATFAAHLDSTYSFFKPGDKALVYIITDENDRFATATASNSSLLAPKSIYQEFTTPMVTLLVVKVKGYTAKWDIYEYRENKVDTYLLRTDQNDSFSTLADCQASFAGIVQDPLKPPFQNPRCAAADKLLISDPLAKVNLMYGTSFATEVEACNYIVANKASLFPGFSSPENNLRCGPFLLEDNDHSQLTKTLNTYFLGLNKDSRPEDAIAKVKTRIEDLFGNAFYMAVSTNITGQPCALKTGQSFDSFYSSYLPSSALGSILNSDSYAINSICSTDDDLKTFLTKLSFSFEKKVNEQFNVELFAGEELISLKYSSGGTSTDLIPNVDYVVASGFIQIKNNHKMQSLDKIEVVIKTPPIPPNPTPGTGGGTYHGG